MFRLSVVKSKLHFLFMFIPLLMLMGSVINAHAAPPNNKLSFSVIKTADSAGSLEALVVEGGSWFTVRKLVHTAVLVKHPKGDFLWDSGIGFEHEAQMSVLNFYEKQLLKIENIHPAYEQLMKNNYDIKSLMAIIPSHMHWDHVSGLEDFAGIPIWLQQSSLEEAKNGHVPSFIQSQYDSTDLNWQFLTLSNRKYQGFDKSFDIYGDGSAVLVDLSGHTEGHLGLFLHLGGTRSYFFIGDTAWSIKGIEERKSRPAIVQWLMGVDSDFDENAKLIEKIHSLSKVQPELIIIPAHDERQLEKLPAYPVFSQ